MSTAQSARQLVLQALAHEEPERCPYYIWVDEHMVPALAMHFGELMFLRDGAGPVMFAHSCTAMTEITARHVSDDGQCFTDEYGVTYRRGAALHVERPPLAEPSLKDYTFPDLSTDEHFAHLDGWIAEHNSRFRIVQLGMMFFERTWGLRGMEDILMDFHLHPVFAHELLDGLEAVCMKVLDRLLLDHADRIDAVGFSEDYGSESSMLISPGVWREFIKPRLGRMVQKIRDARKFAYIHSCGHVLPVIPDLIEIGINMLQPLQPEAMDIFEIKRKFGKDLCLVGGISTQRTLPRGTVDDVRRDVDACLTRMAQGGGYIMAPAKPILADVPLENAIALIEAFVQQDAYTRRQR